MHKIDIDPGALARIRQWRGTDHPFADLDPKKTAHLVVDMQNAFTLEGAELEVPVSREIIPNINAISDALRAAGGVNIFTQMTIDDETEKTWRIWLRDFSTPERAAESKRLLADGAFGHAIDERLSFAESDILLHKNRYSSFVPGASIIMELLQERGIDTLIITGTVTNCCCESHARDAMQRDFRVIFVSDGNAALSDADHNGTLNNMVQIFADVATADEVVGFIEQSRLKGAA
jgi:ureidoacrylate peracid hydrolase